MGCKWGLVFLPWTRPSPSLNSVPLATGFATQHYIFECYLCYYLSLQFMFTLTQYFFEVLRVSGTPGP